MSLGLSQEHLHHLHLSVVWYDGRSHSHVFQASELADFGWNGPGDEPAIPKVPAHGELVDRV